MPAYALQVTLYQLLMEERYSCEVEQGLLWNLQEARPELISRCVGEHSPCSPFSSMSILMAEDVSSALCCRLSCQASISIACMCTQGQMTACLSAACVWRSKAECACLDS